MSERERREHARSGPMPDPSAGAGSHRPTLLMISFSQLARDPRVHRHVRALLPHFEITTLGFGETGIPGVRAIRVERAQMRPILRVASKALLMSRSFSAYHSALPWVRQARSLLAGQRWDVVFANDPDTWPLAAELPGRPVRVFDAHEYAPLEFEMDRKWMFFFSTYATWLCERYLPLADVFFTVSPGIRDLYRQTLGADATVIFNAPDLEELAPSSAEADRIRLVHHGAAIPGRRIESMIEAMHHLDDRFSLDFYLVSHDDAYLARLRRAARKDARIRFREPVPMRSLARALQPYDVGVYLLSSRSTNERLALPNKLFEFIQARLAVAIGPSPEMAQIVRKWGCGVVADGESPEAFARCLRSLDTSEIARLKERSHLAAMELCAERGAATVARMVCAAAGLGAGVTAPS